MADTIRVLIVDDLPETRENVRKLLQFEPDIEVIGQAGNGEQAIEMARKHQPDIVLMDINMPGIDGIGASQKISDLVPGTQVIIMSVQSDSDYLRRAMLAGARDFLTKPFGADQLSSAVRRVYKKRPQVTHAPVSSSGTSTGAPQTSSTDKNGTILTVYSPKGGSGCTTIAINLAVSLAKRNQKTILVDASLQFGDVAVMLNMKADTSIVDVMNRGGEMDSELISSVVRLHRSGLSVLLAPPKPEMADVVTNEYMVKLLSILKTMYDYIIVDTSSWLNDVALDILDNSDKIVLVAEQSLPTLKNTSRFFDLSETLSYNKENMWLVVNKVSGRHNIKVNDIGKTLKREIVMAIPEDHEVSDMAADQGVPIVSSDGRQPIILTLVNLADYVIEQTGGSGSGETEAEAVKQPQQTGLLGRLFGGRS